MDTYIILNDAETIELEAFTNFKLSGKKVKSTTWFQYEPQRLEFRVYGFGGEAGDNDWEDDATNFYDILRFAFNFPDNNYKGMSQTKIKLKKNGSIIFTGYIDITQSKINEVEQIADFVCYDILKVISLLTDEYVPYGKYTFGQFLNNSYYAGSSILAAYDFDLTDKLSRLGFTATLSLSGNLIDDSVTQYIYENTNEFDYNYYVQYFKGFYTYDDVQLSRTTRHLFFVYFQINLSGTDIIKNIKIFEIVNGYCPVDALYEENSVSGYSTLAEASADIDNQITEEINNINNAIPEWGEDWFALNQIQDNEIILDGYSYTYENSTNPLSRRIAVTGNIFPNAVMIGDSNKIHQPIRVLGYYTKPNYSKSSWVSVFKDLLIGNNLVMKVTRTGNIEIRNITYNNPIGITDDIIGIERKIQLVTTFSGLDSLDGNTDDMKDNYGEYYRDYLKLLNVYNIQVNTDVIDNIIREIDVLNSFSYSSKYFLILKIDNDIDNGKYDCECIEVS